MKTDRRTPAPADQRVHLEAIEKSHSKKLKQHHAHQLCKLLVQSLKLKSK